MAGTTVTIVGNLAADPELKHTEQGHARATLRVACNDGYFDRETNEWRDREPVFMRVTAWRDLAKNVVASLRKGDRVVVIGKLSQFTFEPEPGQRRTLTQLEATSVAVDLTRAVAQVARFRKTGVIAETEDGEGVDLETGEILDEETIDAVLASLEPTEEAGEPVPF